MIGNREQGTGDRDEQEEARHLFPVPCSLFPPVEIVIEWVVGDPQRYEWDEAADTLRPADDERVPPEHYGCVPGALNPADGELLDVLLLRDIERRPGERVDVRLIGMLRRADGDHKLLAVDRRYHQLTDVSEVDPTRLQAIWGWFRRQHVLLGWEGPAEAYATLANARHYWMECRG
jgi:inorganic pyrophosphatase